MQERIYIPQLQIRHHSALSYSIPAEPFRGGGVREQRSGAYSGEITDAARRRIRRVCEILVMRSPARILHNCKFSLVFATVTISAHALVPHREAYEQGLSPLLRWMRRKMGCSDYIWKAELQQRGQIHYHITTNQFVPWRALRHEWNNIQTSAGWMSGYFAQTGHRNPNSTDIRAVAKIDRIDLYLSKYISKSGGKIEGKVWDCSKSLRGKKFFAFERDWDTDDAIRKVVAQPGTREIRTENCTIIDTPRPRTLIPAREAQNFAAWLK